MSIYADSSLVVSLYITDVHSREGGRRMARRPRVWLTPLHQVEWSHAVAQNVFRKRLSMQEGVQLYSAFEADRGAGFWVDVGMPESAYERSVELARRYGPQFGTRTLDTLHVACALELGAREFWTFDERQKRLAKTVGLSTA